VSFADIAGAAAEVANGGALARGAGALAAADAADADGGADAFEVGRSHANTSTSGTGERFDAEANLKIERAVDARRFEAAASDTRRFERGCRGARDRARLAEAVDSRAVQKWTALAFSLAFSSRGSACLPAPEKRGFPGSPPARARLRRPEEQSPKCN